MRYVYRHPEYFDGIERPDFSLCDNLVIYGAGFQAALAIHFLRKQGVKIHCIIDNDIKKQGGTFLEHDILSPSVAMQKYPDCEILVTPFNHESAYKFVKNVLKPKNVYTPFSLFLNMELDEFVKTDGLPQWFYTEMEMDDHTFIWHLDRYLRKVANAYFPEKYKHGLELSVSEICNLRCKECNAYMPYYAHPQHFPVNDIKIALDKLLKGRVFDYITIEGGETFVYPDILDICRHIRKYNVDHCVLLSNGTILPNDNMLKELADLNISIRFSYYGKYSIKLADFIKKCKQFGIMYYVFNSDWTEFSQINLTAHTDQEVQEIITDCYKGLGKSGPYLRGSTLYRCPFAGNTENLGILPVVPEDTINLLQEDSKELQKSIEDFFLDPKAVFACKYCKGRGYTSKKVPVAEQLPRGIVPKIKRIDV
jgi:MoaA/NifB/PqqE/SkfB family radical SAM enzyme